MRNYLGQRELIGVIVHQDGTRESVELIVDLFDDDTAKFRPAAGGTLDELVGAENFRELIIPWEVDYGDSESGDAPSPA